MLSLRTILIALELFALPMINDKLLSCQVVPGAYLTDQYLHLIENKKVGVVANHSSFIEETHLIDSLITLNIDIVRIFSPEHGFRGNADAGEKVNDYIDPVTKIEVVSLYGSNVKPSSRTLENIDILLFDIQDVGVRFYTYISTLHYVMEAAAENNIPVVVLDRPNPNGFYVDGPVLDTAFSSFVGIHPIPLVYGMTIGELALMINGEGWLLNNSQCRLSIVKCLNYDHLMTCKLPIAPSPNLPNHASVLLYPSLGLFEGTIMSVGRGTDIPFQVYGHPEFPVKEFSFVPRSMPGKAKDPKYMNKRCFGRDLREISTEIIPGNSFFSLSYLLDGYRLMHEKETFFNIFFYNLVGTNELRSQIEHGLTNEEIQKSWQQLIESFKTKRKNYLLYPDFD